MKVKIDDLVLVSFLLSQALVSGEIIFQIVLMDNKLIGLYNVDRIFIGFSIHDYLSHFLL